MDLRVSVVLLFIFLTGGNSLKCYKCTSDYTGYCDAKEETCPAGVSKCETTISELSNGSAKVTFTTKRCAEVCVPGTQQLTGGTMSVRCCDTDLCNAAGNSLKCYKCTSDYTGYCDAKEKTCPAGVSKCETSTVEQSVGPVKMTFTTKDCAEVCVPGTHQVLTGGTMSVRCCDTDLCNAADGVFKGSFLLLVSPLLFYFLFQ